MKGWASYGFCACWCIFAPSATYAQQIAHSDVFFTYGQSQIEIARQDDRLAIPQIMPDSGFFAQANVNPGFFSEQDIGGGTGANDIVGYNVLDDLLFWSDGEFTTPKATTEVRIINNPRSVEDVLIGTGTGEQRASFDPLKNSIGQSSDGGNFHSHVDFRLEPLSADPEEAPLPGAYGLKLSLSTDNPSIQESDPFFIVYRFGIEDELFGQALDDFEALLSTSDGVLGDFNSDGVLTSVDIDLLSAEVANGSHTATFDLTEDGLVNPFDRTKWVEEIVGTFFGDTDLNSSVEFSDFLALSASFGSDAGWSDGDFDGDGVVQFPDFLVLSANFGKTAAAVATVPEPDCLAPFVAILIVFVRRRRIRVAQELKAIST